jgi:hypothetical protein
MNTASGVLTLGSYAVSENSLAKSGNFCSS